MTKLKLKDVEEATSLKKGNRADAMGTQLALGQIKRLYEEKGYPMAEVALVEGGQPGDTKVVIGVFEGPQHYVRSIDFKGNVFATDAQLKTKITSRTGSSACSAASTTARTSKKTFASSSSITSRRASSR